MRLIGLIAGSVIALNLCGIPRLEASSQAPLKEIKGEHFILFAPEDNDANREILDRAEEYYRQIADDLEFPRHSEFWMWDDRVRIVIYPDAAAYQKATGEASWSQGIADPEKRTVSSFLGNADFLESVLPHEIAHLIARDFFETTSDKSIPVWLDEGIAQWAEYMRTRDDLKAKAKKLYDNNALLPLSDIFHINIRMIKKEEQRLFLRSTIDKKDRYSVLVLSPDVLIDTFYIESGSLVCFLNDRYGALRFVQFCRELRDGKKPAEALAVTYAEHIPSLKDLERQWRDSLKS